MATKAEMIASVADAAGVSKADAERTLGAFFDYVVAETKKGDKEKADDSKMKVAGLYETNKVANVKSVKGNHPVS